MRSEPGLFLDGRVMPPPSPFRHRPEGHAAVLVGNGKPDQYTIQYVPCPAHEKADKEQEKRLRP